MNDTSTDFLNMSLQEQAAHSANEFKDDLDPSTLFVMLAMYRTFAALDKNQTEELATVNLNTTQFNVLTALHRIEQPIPMRALSQLVAIRPTNLTGVVESLKKLGFVKRKIDGNDRRSLLVTLSAKGEKFLQGFLPWHFRRMEALMSDLSPKERNRLAILLKRLRESVESHANDDV